MRDAPAKKPSIIDSPWYWLYLFATAGLVALMLMGPRYSARQAQIEQKYQGRQLAALHAHGVRHLDADSVPSSPGDDTAVKLWPLYLVLGGLLAVAWARLWWTRWGGGKASRSDR